MMQRIEKTFAGRKLVTRRSPSSPSGASSAASPSCTIEFTFDSKDGAAWLKGTAKIKRLDFGVGQGEWKDTSTVGNEVQVRFALRLKSAT